MFPFGDGLHYTGSTLSKTVGVIFVYSNIIYNINKIVS